MTAFTVIKRDASGEDKLSYTGVISDRGDSFVCVDAIFGFADRDLGYVQLRQGDRFREWFFADRWFNIFRIQDVAARQLKGWYCNITRPPIIAAKQVAADDLCLDVFVRPDGATVLLDENEYRRLNLSRAEQDKAWEAVTEIYQMVNLRLPPFDEIEVITP